MSTLGEQAPLQELFALLGHKNSWVQDTVIESLKKLVPYIPVERLLSALDESNLLRA